MTIFNNLENFQQSWQFLTILTIFENCWQFLTTIVDNFDKIDNADNFDIFDNFDNFFTIQTIAFTILTIEKTILETYDIWDTDYSSDNWKPEFMTIFVTFLRCFLAHRAVLINNKCPVSVVLVLAFNQNVVSCLFFLSCFSSEGIPTVWSTQWYLWRPDPASRDILGKTRQRGFPYWRKHADGTTASQTVSYVSKGWQGAQMCPIF